MPGLLLRFSETHLSSVNSNRPSLNKFIMKASRYFSLLLLPLVVVNAATSTTSRCYTKRVSTLVKLVPTTTISRTFSNTYKVTVTSTPTSYVTPKKCVLCSCCLAVNMLINSCSHGHLDEHRRCGWHYDSSSSHGEFLSIKVRDCY